MPIATVHVNNKPLSGSWDGHAWEPQTARCSNNFMSGPNPPVAPPSAAGGLVWQVVGPPDPSSVVFSVMVDLPGDDEVLFTGVRNGNTTPFLPIPNVDALGEDHATKLHRGHRWDEYYLRGIYIARVFGAPVPFTINVLGAAEGNPCLTTWIGSLTIRDAAPVTINLGEAASLSRPSLPANAE